MRYLSNEYIVLGVIDMEEVTKGLSFFSQTDNKSIFIPSVKYHCSVSKEKWHLYSVKTAAFEEFSLVTQSVTVCWPVWGKKTTWKYSDKKDKRFQVTEKYS